MSFVRDRLEDYINKYVELWGFFGVIQVIQKGEVLFNRAYGYANIEHGIKNEINSCFSIASLSKQFTAFAIMLLYEKEMLELDKSAQLYLPDDLRIDESITIHHLLSHTSGLPNFYNFENDFFGEYNRMEFSRNEFFQKFINKKPSNSPGSVYDYNNANYNLLAWIVEHVSGESYDTFIRENIFRPLHMLNTDVDDGRKTIRNKSSNYTIDFETTTKSPYHNEKFSIGAGAIVSNSEDLHKWYACLRDRRILSGHSYARFFNKNKNSYCYGLEYHHVYGTDRYAHGGDHLGVSTYMQNFFAEDLCIIILSNNEAIDQYRLGNSISDILHHVDVANPEKHHEFPMSKKKLQEYVGAYLKDKIEIEFVNSKLYLTRFSGNLHIEIYPVGEGRFVRRYSDQTHPYVIDTNDNGIMTFFGYPKSET